MSGSIFPPKSEDPNLGQVRRPSRRDEPSLDLPGSSSAGPIGSTGRPAAASSAPPDPSLMSADEIPPPIPGATQPVIDDVVLRQLATDNPLLAAALPLLTLVCQLRGTLRHDNVPRLQFMVSEELKAFESRALLAEVSPQDVIAARYVLCSLIDETVLSTPWGGQSLWASQSMLSIFHKETWGGEKVFVILDRIKSKPSRYLHLIELIDTCLALGFRGRYEVQENGRYLLDDLRGEVWRIVRGQRNVSPRPLAPEMTVERVRRSLVRYVPLWMVFAIAGGLLVAIYGGFQYALIQRVDVVADSVDSINPARR